MCGFQEYLKSLNPRSDSGILIYGKQYKLWRNGKYLGIATWTKDGNVGDSFQNSAFDKESGHIIQKVYVADSWEIVFDELK